MRLSILLISIATIVQGFSQVPELIFHSGFEPGTKDTTNGFAADLFGADNSVPPPNDWVFDLEAHPNIGTFGLQYQGGDDTMRWARIVPDPIDPSNNTLSFWLKHPNVGGTKGRVQANLYENQNLFEVSQKVRLYLPSDWNIIKDVPAVVHWLTIMEFWNNLPLQDSVHPFRITLGIHKNDTTSPDLTFGIEAQMMPDNQPWPIVWDEFDSTFSIPLEQWMTLEFYFKEGDNNTGRFIFAVTPDGGTKQVIFDITNYTHHPSDNTPDGLARYNPMKLYTSDALIDYVRSLGGVLQVYWDDFELWKDGNILSVEPLENDSKSHFTIYPNPMKESALLTFKNPKNELHQLSIYNIHGKLIKSISGIRSSEVIIEKNGLTTGLYFLQLSTNEKITATGKLMIE